MFEVGVDGVGEATQQPSPVARRHRTPGLEGPPGPGDRGICLLLVDEVDHPDDLLRGRVEDRVLHRAHIRSKLRTRSQSVMAASKAVSSMRAVFT